MHSRPLQPPSPEVAGVYDSDPRPVGDADLESILADTASRPPPQKPRSGRSARHAPGWRSRYADGKSAPAQPQGTTAPTALQGWEAAARTDADDEAHGAGEPDRGADESQRGMSAVRAKGKWRAPDISASDGEAERTEVPADAAADRKPEGAADASAGAQVDGLTAAQPAKRAGETRPSRADTDDSDDDGTYVRNPFDDDD